MGKTKTKSRSGSIKDVRHSINAPSSKKMKQQMSTNELLTSAATLLEQAQPESALPRVEEALQRLEAQPEHYQNIDTLLSLVADGRPTFPQALILGADINLALGDVDTARLQFIRATNIDPDGAVISAEPWLWLSQLSEEGGRESVAYFEKAIEVLRNEIDVLEDAEAMTIEQNQQVLDEKRSKLANTLCGMTEIYMTDLSWEEDAEARCEQYVTEAVAVCPERLSAGVLQTLASVRISQERIDDARQALQRSMSIWKQIPDEIEDPAKPDFATRVSLARLLMEVEDTEDATFVLEGLIKEDDQSVESLYLAGWCQVLLSQKPGVSGEAKLKHEEQARLWLASCLKLYTIQEYEDVRLQEHASDLVSELNRILGITDDDDDGWVDEDDDDDNDADAELEINGTASHEDVDVEMT